jgi:hypothetical protein
MVPDASYDGYTGKINQHQKSKDEYQSMAEKKF